jgi:hypothetical protein
MADDDALGGLLDAALAGGDDAALRSALLHGSGLPGPRMNLRLVWRFAAAVGEVVASPMPADTTVAALESLLDGWAALTEEEAPGNEPAAMLPCAAVAAYGEVGATRPDWWDDEVAKLHRAAADPRWRVRELVAQAIQRLLAADWPRMAAVLLTWADEAGPLVVRAAAAGVAEPPLLASDVRRAADAMAIQRRAVANLQRRPAAERRDEDVRVLRTGLAFTVGVATAATGDFALLEEMAASGDADLRWAARHNLRKARLRPWPEHVAAVEALLDA